MKRDRKDLGRTGNTDRLKVLDLSIDDPYGPRAAGDGYNPYDTWPSVQSSDSTRRNKDLRRLSEWIRLKRQVEALKEQEDPGYTPPDDETTGER
jgi:hypothetical protein